LEQQNAVVDAGYSMTEQVPDLRRQQSVLHASVSARWDEGEGQN
jgi:hypothetical protein